MTEHSPELDEIVGNAVTAAYKAIPDPIRWSKKVIAAISLVLVVLVGDSGLTTYNSIHLASVTRCNQLATVAGRNIAQQDRTAVDGWINGVRADLKSKSLTLTQLDKVFSHYERARASNDAARTAAYAKPCD
jgi:hypothetical protein